MDTITLIFGRTARVAALGFANDSKKSAFRILIQLLGQAEHSYRLGYNLGYDSAEEVREAREDF